MHTTAEQQRVPFRDPTASTLLVSLFADITEISSLPDVAARIIEAASDPSTSADDLMELILLDPALVTRIVRTANSSRYSPKKPIADLKPAVTLLGFKEIRNLALTAFLAEMFQTSAGHGTYTRAGLWNHLVGTGAVARAVAESCRKVPPSEAYLAGLLHDVGLILADQYLHKAFCRVVDAMDEDVRVCDMERRVLGFDHTTLGEFVALKWNLPEMLVAAIRHHHAPDRYRGRHAHLVSVVALADVLCNFKGVTAVGVRHKEVPSPEMFAGLGLGKAELTALWGRLDEVLATADVLVAC